MYIKNLTYEEAQGRYFRTPDLNKGAHISMDSDNVWYCHNTRGTKYKSRSVNMSGYDYEFEECDKYGSKLVQEEPLYSDRDAYLKYWDNIHNNNVPVYRHKLDSPITRSNMLPSEWSSDLIIFSTSSKRMTDEAFYEILQRKRPQEDTKGFIIVDDSKRNIIYVKIKDVLNKYLTPNITIESRSLTRLPIFSTRQSATYAIEAYNKKS